MKFHMKMYVALFICSVVFIGGSISKAAQVIKCGEEGDEIQIVLDSSKSHFQGDWSGYSDVGDEDSGEKIITKTGKIKLTRTSRTIHPSDYTNNRYLLFLTKSPNFQIGIPTDVLDRAADKFQVWIIQKGGGASAAHSWMTPTREGFFYLDCTSRIL